MEINVGYHSSFRMFGFFRKITVDFNGEPHTCNSEIMHSCGCKLISCVYDGFCKDCPYVYEDMFSL